MTNEDRIMLKRINDYAEEVLADIDPQKTRISFQLDKLRPIMQQLAMEKQVPVEDIFIKYMDLASEAKVEQENRLQQELDDAGLSFSSRANRVE